MVFPIVKKLLFFGLVVVIAGSIINVCKVSSFLRITDKSNPEKKYPEIPKIISGINEAKEALLFGKDRGWTYPLESEKEIPLFLRKYSDGLGGGTHTIYSLTPFWLEDYPGYYY